MPATVPTPCRICKANRSVAEAVSYGSVCESCFVGLRPATNQRRVRREMDKGASSKPQGTEVE